MIANYALPLLFTLVFLLGFFLMKNFALIAYSPLKYFGNPQNILEALMILLCISYVILFNFDTKLIRGHIASVALIGVWTNLTVLMGKIPAAGIYIIMIANVAKGINIRFGLILGIDNVPQIFFLYFFAGLQPKNSVDKVRSNLLSYFIHMTLNAIQSFKNEKN